MREEVNQLTKAMQLLSGKAGPEACVAYGFPLTQPHLV